MEIDVTTSYSSQILNVEEEDRHPLEKQTRMLQAKNISVSQIVNLRPGQKLTLELEALRESDQDCTAMNVTIKDGPNKQVFTDLFFRVNTAVVSAK